MLTAGMFAAMIESIEIIMSAYLISEVWSRVCRSQRLKQDDFKLELWYRSIEVGHRPCWAEDDRLDRLTSTI